jgi:predicted TIM-barrel fold metal-dependent hydrolase
MSTSAERKAPGQAMRRFWHGTEVMSHAALLGATHAVGIDRVLFSIDYPFESSAEAVEFLCTAPSAPTDLERIAHGNAERILWL